MTAAGIGPAPRPTRRSGETQATWNSMIVDALQPPRRTDLVQTMREDDAGRAFAEAERLFAPTFISTVVWPHGRAEYEGPDGLWTAWNDWLRSWRHYVVDSYELETVGERVVVLAHAHGTVAADRDPDGRRATVAGQEVKARPATIWRFQDGRLLNADFYDSRLDAVEALGLFE